MYETQFKRLVSSLPLNLSDSEASSILARAYGRESYDPATGKLGPSVTGLQPISEPSALLKEDSSHQMMEFLRMAVNLSLPGLGDVRKGIGEKVLVSTMWGFQNFDALVNYARNDPVDPSSVQPEMLEKFRVRYGYYAPIQVILGRGFYENALLIHTDSGTLSRYINQEVALNPKTGTRVAIVRTNPNGDGWLNLYLNTMRVYRGELQENHSSILLGAADETTDTFVSIVPARTYKLSALVSAHLNALSRRSPAGRALIIDGVEIDHDIADIDHALALAKSVGINVVLTQLAPNSELWDRFGVRMVFDFDRNLETSDLEMDSVLVGAAPYIGTKRNKMQYAYHSAETGLRYAAMDLIPDDTPAGGNIIGTNFSKKRG